MKQLEKKSRKESSEAQAASAQIAEKPSAQLAPATNAQAAPAENAQSAEAQAAKVANIAMTATLAKDEPQTAEEPQAEAKPEAQPAEKPQAEAEAEVQSAAPATVAHCSAEETVEVTDAELQSRSRQTAATKGEDEPLASASPGGPAMVNAAEVEKLVNEAYLRGRNEAIECRMIADTSLFGSVAGQDTTGMRADFSSLFETRKSVWGNTL